MGKPVEITCGTNLNSSDTRPKQHAEHFGNQRPCGGGKFQPVRPDPRANNIPIDLPFRIDDGLQIIEVFGVDVSGNWESDAEAEAFGDFHTGEQGAFDSGGERGGGLGVAGLESVSGCPESV